MHKSANEKSEFDFGLRDDLAPYSVNFAAFHSKLEYEINEIQNGQRLSLVYSLRYAKETPAQFLNTKGLVPNLASALYSLSQAKDNNRLGLLLDHKQDDLSRMDSTFSSLQSMNKNRFSLLHQANQLLPREHRFHFFLLRLEITHTEYADNDELDEDNFDSMRNECDETGTKLVITQWYDDSETKCDYKTKFHYPQSFL